MNSLAEPRKWEKYFWPVLASALFLALWHYSVIWSATKVFPSPLAVEKGMAQLAGKGLLWSYIADSLRRVALGFGAAVLVGVPVGILSCKFSGPSAPSRGYPSPLFFSASETPPPSS